MNTIFNRQRHLRLYGATLAMAALLIALLAVTISAGPAIAQEPRTGDNEDYYDKPIPCSEEATPDSDTKRVITEGFYPLFEGF